MKRERLQKIRRATPLAIRAHLKINFEMSSKHFIVGSFEIVFL